MGTALHALVERHGDLAACQQELDALEPEETETVAGWFEAWLGDAASSVAWQHEVPFAYDWESDTCRVLSGNRRDYMEVTETELPGTADLVCIDPNTNTVFVADIKTGFGANSEPVQAHSQLRFLALCAARHAMVDRAVIQIIRIDDGGLRPTEYTIEAHELDAIRDELRRVVRRIHNAQPQPGGHCSSLWCPAIAVCPATTSLAKANLGESLARKEFALTYPTSDEHALWLRDGADVLEEIASRMRTEARKYADQKGGVTLPDGRKWGSIEVERETIALNGPGGAEAIDLLARHAPGAVEVSYKTSKEAIKKAIAKNKKLTHKELSGAVNEVLVPLRAIGATRTATIKRYEESKK